MNKEWVVKEPEELLKHLFSMMPNKSRNAVKSILGRGQVMVNGKVSKQFNDSLKPGDRIEILSQVVTENMRLKGIKVIHEDDDVIVIEKDAGLLTIADHTEQDMTAYRQVTRYIQQLHPKRQIFIVHRLDRDTSGLLIFAKSQEVQQKLQKSWETSVKERTYIALVEGTVKEGGTVTSWLTEGKTYKVHSSPVDNGGKKAITHYKVLKSSRDFSMLRVNLDTGRKNQIRVHMQDIGHPVVGDKKYGSRLNPARRLGLHAHAIKFVHPRTGKMMRFESKAPAAFLKVFKSGK